MKFSALVLSGNLLEAKRFVTDRLNEEALNYLDELKAFYAHTIFTEAFDANKFKGNTELDAVKDEKAVSGEDEGDMKDVPDKDEEEDEEENSDDDNDGETQTVRGKRGDTINVNIKEEHRPVHVIAREIKKNWPKVNYGAKPYLDAMHSLNSHKDDYGQDSGKSVIGYFLSNANSYRGEHAKKHKNELKAMLKESQGLPTRGEVIPTAHGKPSQEDGADGPHEKPKWRSKQKALMGMRKALGKTDAVVSEEQNGGNEGAGGRAAFKSYTKRLNKKMPAKAKTDAVVSEEADDIQELKKSTLGSYIKKSTHDVARINYDAAREYSKSRGVSAKGNDLMNKSFKRQQGVFKATQKLVDGKHDK